VGYGLIATFALLPFLRLRGRPLVLLDVAHREFTLGGRVFLATDGVLLMLLMLTLFVGIIWLSTLLGRAWCGWGCPQTVYMELLYRPLERLLEGGRSRLAEGVRRILRPRVLLYSAILAGLVTSLILVAASRRGAEVTILRGIGAPFVLQADHVRNQLRVKIEDHSGHGGTYQLELLAHSGRRLVRLDELGAASSAPRTRCVSRPWAGPRRASLWLAPRVCSGGGSCRFGCA
jgi:polyferredoxin